VAIVSSAGPHQGTDLPPRGAASAASVGVVSLPPGRPNARPASCPTTPTARATSWSTATTPSSCTPTP